MMKRGPGSGLRSVRPGGWLAAKRARSDTCCSRGEYLDHLYVLPGWQRRGVGLALLGKAKALGPKQVRVSTFRRNAGARAFYEIFMRWAIAAAATKKMSRTCRKMSRTCSMYGNGPGR
ncbi:GNAT family N-acetyltransferase [Rhodopila sp.]|uniref:GNAT family N-acetyltransferase n=1 Tax=Rhodopila sp. TaxID=2480087 RepID=UPI003D0C95CA